MWKKLIVLGAIVISAPLVTYTVLNIDKGLSVEAPELYVSIYPHEGYVFIKEYKLSTTLNNKQKIEKQTQKIKSLVQECKLTETHFNFKHFTVMEEALNVDRGMLTGEYHLFTKSENTILMFEDIFSGILKRPVKVTLNKNVGIHFNDKENNLGFNGRDKAEVYKKGNQISIFWKNGLPYYDIVISKKNRSIDSYNSLYPAIKDSISGIRKNEYEIYNWQSGSDKNYQHDMDINRLRNLKVLGQLIEKYKEKMGYYPLQNQLDSYEEIYVHIGTPSQEEQAKKFIPNHMREMINSGKLKIIETGQFYKVLQNGLGEKVSPVFDLQKAALHIPNVYVYATNKDSYYLAIYTFNYFPFSQVLGRFIYKNEISNQPINKPKVWSYNDLMNNEDYKKAISQKIIKPQYIDDLNKALEKKIKL